MSECEHKTKFCSGCGKEISIDIPECSRPAEKKKLWEILRTATYDSSAGFSEDCWNGIADAAKKHIISELPSADKIKEVYYTSQHGMVEVLDLIKQRINQA